MEIIERHVLVDKTNEDVFVKSLGETTEDINQVKAYDSYDEAVNIIIDNNWGDWATVRTIKIGVPGPEDMQFKYSNE